MAAIAEKTGNILDVAMLCNHCYECEILENKREIWEVNALQFMDWSIISIFQIAWWIRKKVLWYTLFISNLFFYFSFKLLRENHDSSLTVAVTGGKKVHVNFCFGNGTTCSVSRFGLFLSLTKEGEIVQKNMSAVICYSVWILLRNSSYASQNTSFSCLQFSKSQPETCWGVA